MQLDLVFEGGGAKGIALVGAWDYLQGQGYTHNRVLGTSAGAIMAVLLAAGYSTQEMVDALTEHVNGQPVLSSFLGEPMPFTDTELNAGALAKFLTEIDIPFVPEMLESGLDRALLKAMAGDPRSRHVVALVERGGWYGAGSFVQWLQRMLDAPTPGGQARGYSKLTLAQFYEATQVDMSVVASDTTSASMLVLNHRTAPDCPVVYSVRMSMSIPFLWEEVVWQPEWGTYRGEPIVDHSIVDGGMLSNFPIELFLSDLANVTDVMGPKLDYPVLGLLIDERLPLPPAPQGRGLKQVAAKVSELRTVQRLRRIVDTMLSAHDKMVIEAYKGLVVRLPAEGYGTTEFDMSDERRTALIAAAQDATAQHVQAYPPGVTTRAAAAAPATGQDAIDAVAATLLR